MKPQVTQAAIEWLNHNKDLVEYLEQAGVSVPFNGKVYCPFHHNVNTPAGKVYTAGVEDQKPRLYCYVCRRSYYVFDVLRLMNYSDVDIMNMVPEEKRYLNGSEAPVYNVPVFDVTKRKSFDSPFALLSFLDMNFKTLTTQ